MKAKEARPHWQATFEQINEVENRLIVLIPRVELYGLDNPLHMLRIAKGNVSTVKEILLYNQQKIEQQLAKPSKGGKK